MKSAKLHPEEEDRLRALLHYEILDTEDEQAFDELTELASTICGTPISLISLVDDHRQWFKSKVGLNASQTDKEIAFCSHAILKDDVFEVENALEDERFVDNPLVTGAPDIRFYAGAPLINTDGLPIGTLCVIDQKPRKLTPSQTRALAILARQVIGQMEVRLNNRRMHRTSVLREKLFATIAHDLKSPFNGILNLSRYLKNQSAKLSGEKIGTIAEDILSASMDLYQLLDELLQWSKNQLGATRPKCEAMDVTLMVEDSVKLMKDAIQLKSLNLTMDIDIACKALGDKTLTKSIVRNLLSNAIKYCPKSGDIGIKITAISEKVQLAITNSGEAIAPSVAGTLFNTDIESLEGTVGEQGNGLGLSLCKTFVELQSGKIWHDACFEQGARFVVELDRAT